MYRLLQSVMFLSLAGCAASTDAEKTDKKAGTLTLYSLHANDVEPDKRPKTAEHFHGFPVLGKVEIAKADDRKAIDAAMQAGIGKGQMAKCFLPRHGIRVLVDGKQTDYVICFECGRVVVHDIDSRDEKSIDNSPAAPLDKFLKDAGIPQDKPAH
jgi:hypothetical protein